MKSKFRLKEVVLLMLGSALITLAVVDMINVNREIEESREKSLRELESNRRYIDSVEAYLDSLRVDSLERALDLKEVIDEEK